MKVSWIMQRTVRTRKCIDKKEKILYYNIV